jgi:hypothetical protein
LLTGLPLAGAMEESRKSKLLWKSAPHVTGPHYSIGLAAGAIVALAYWGAVVVMIASRRRRKSKRGVGRHLGCPRGLDPGYDSI